eukprot:5856166-Amphidinium_carterae.1
MQHVSRGGATHNSSHNHRVPSKSANDKIGDMASSKVSHMCKTTKTSGYYSFTKLGSENKKIGKSHEPRQHRARLWLCLVLLTEAWGNHANQNLATTLRKVSEHDTTDNKRAKSRDSAVLARYLQNVLH